MKTTEQSNTPETDAHINENIRVTLQAVVCHDFARKLERERDEAIQMRDIAMRELANCQTHFEVHDAKDLGESVHMAVLHALQERDQLRKVADELALVIKTCNAHGYGLKIGDEVLDTYNNLPHRKL